MVDWKSGRNALTAAVLAGMSAWAYQSLSASGRETEPAWSFDMWCLEMQLYSAKRCDARTPEDLKDYSDYRANVDKLRQNEQAKDKRDQDILQRFNRNLPGETGPSDK